MKFYVVLWRRSFFQNYIQYTRGVFRNTEAILFGTRNITTAMGLKLLRVFLAYSAMSSFGKEHYNSIIQPSVLLVILENKLQWFQWWIPTQYVDTQIISLKVMDFHIVRTQSIKVRLTMEQLQNASLQKRTHFTYHFSKIKSPQFVQFWISHETLWIPLIALPQWRHGDLLFIPTCILFI